MYKTGYYKSAMQHISNKRRHYYFASVFTSASLVSLGSRSEEGSVASTFSLTGVVCSWVADAGVSLDGGGGAVDSGLSIIDEMDCLVDPFVLDCAAGGNAGLDSSIRVCCSGFSVASDLTAYVS